WLKNVKDEELLNELNTLSQNQKELEYRFSNYLKFSTAGLRGILGAGLNNINIYTISKAIQGLANYLKQNFKKPLVIIAYDNRKYSQRFAFLSAEILAKNNIKSMVFESLTP